MKVLPPVTRSVWAVLVIAALLGSLALGWASFQRVDSTVQTTRTLGPLHETICTNFARSKVECRRRWLPSKTDWQLLPLFSGLRFGMAGVLLVALALTSLWGLGRFSLRPLLSWIGALGLLSCAVFIAAVPGDTRYVSFMPSWGSLLTVIGFLLMYATGFERRTLDRAVVVGGVGSALLLVALLWAPWVSVAGARGAHIATRYRFGAIAYDYLWQGRRTSRRHYLGKKIREASRRKLTRHLPWYAGMAAASAGAALVGVVLFALRRRALGWTDVEGRRYRRRLFVLLTLLCGLCVAFVALLALVALKHRGQLSAEWGLVALGLGLVSMVWVGVKGLD